MKDLLKNLDGSMAQINNICIEQKPCLPIFNKTDKEVIAEYIEVMTPIAVRLDMLQDEKNAYAGVLLPNFFLLKDNLVELQREVKKFNYAKNLVNYLLKQPKPNKGKEKGFEPRFSRIFDDCDLLMATALHPHFKLGVVRRLNEGKYPAVKTRILEEIKCNIASKLTPPHQGTEGDGTESEMDPFKVSYFYNLEQTLSISCTCLLYTSPSPRD